MLRQLNPVLSSMSYLFKIMCFNNTVWCSRERLPAAAAQPAKVRQNCSATEKKIIYCYLNLDSGSVLLPSCFPIKMCYASPLRMLHSPPISNSWFDHLNTIWWTLQIMAIFNIKLHLLLPLKSKYSSQQFVLKHPLRLTIWSLALLR
jgi:hypothetical protein